MTTRLSLYGLRIILGAAFCALLIPGSATKLRAQQQQPQQPQQKPISNFERQRAQSMLGQIHLELKKNYYDPSFHGMDVDARYQTYLERLKQVPSLGEAFRVIAAYLSGLNDSHTFFTPPRRSYRFDYGYRMAMVGDQCYITDVRPGSDAEKKLHPGDQVLLLGKFGLSRKDLWQLEYYLNQLAPTPATDFTLRDPAGKERQAQVVTKYKTGEKMKDLTVEGGYRGIWEMVMEAEEEQHLLRHRGYEMSDLMIWKMPIFIDDEGALSGMLDKARKHKALILDLRDNPGGEVAALKFLLGGLFDHDVKIGTNVTRKEQKDLVAKSRSREAFTGQLFVLVDSRSASAAEILAKVVQLEHRGTVVGDLTSGSVMESIFYPFQEGADFALFYGASITHADLIMTDGKSLEHIGVTPDVTVGPTAADLAAGRDPALAKAAELAGLKLDPAAAGKLFPFEWAPF
jgi:C-terminal processing protease CtpA/Prc